MTNLNRRSLFCAIPAVICAPAIVRASSLMPVKSWVDPYARYRAADFYWYGPLEWFDETVVQHEIWDALYSNLETVWGPSGKELLAQLGSQ